MVRLRGLRCCFTGVEGIGPTFFGKKEEIYQRARSVYEKEIKQ